MTKFNDHTPKPNYNVLLAACVQCGTKTTRQYARAHEGKCKQCIEKNSNFMKVPKFIIRSVSSGRYLVAVGDTGFKHTNREAAASRFKTLKDVSEFKSERGITWPTTVTLISEEL